MKQPIEVKNIKELIPEKGVWYNYYDTIFISVMRQPNSYIRRKSIIKDGKKDNELSEWHFDWQYNKIESKYGFEKYGEKSFERTINIDEVNHRIDSVVETLAIEFQHTLSVDIGEMNARYSAHSKYGFISYLVIDFTKFTVASFLNCISLDFPNSIKNKFEKWSKCRYAKSNNLFVDLDDGIIRIVNSKEIDSFLIKKDDFLKNLLRLEDQLLYKFKAPQLKKKREEIKEKIRLRKFQIEEIIKRNKLKEQKLEEENNKRESYNNKKLTNDTFKWYQKCIKSTIIKPYMVAYDDIYFEYEYFSSYEGVFFKETHSYKSKDKSCVVEFKRFSSVSKMEIPISRGYTIKKQKKYLYAEIILKKNNQIDAQFKWLKGQKPQKINKNELTLF